MAVVTKKSTTVTNYETKGTQSNNRFSGGRLREFVGTCETAAADDDTSVFLVCPVHSSWRISEIALLNDAITGMTSVGIGLFRTTEDGGAVVSAACFASAVDIAAGNTAWKELTFEGGDIANIEKAVWEILGLTADPNLMYNVGLTFNTMGSGVGTIVVRVRVLAGD